MTEELFCLCLILLLVGSISEKLMEEKLARKILLFSSFVSFVGFVFAHFFARRDGADAMYVWVYIPTGIVVSIVMLIFSLVVVLRPMYENKKRRRMIKVKDRRDMM